MELKFRKKGKIVTLQFGGYIPSQMGVQENMDLDLTGYSVIHACFGKHGDKKAKALHDKAPQAIIVYEYEWRNGWGEGIVLPNSFDSRRIKQYKTEKRKERERQDKELNEIIIFLQNEFPQYQVSLLEHWKMVNHYFKDMDSLLAAIKKGFYLNLVVKHKLGMIEIMEKS